MRGALAGSARGQAIYRIHELPDPKRIVDFEEVAADYGQTLGFGIAAGEEVHDEGGPAGSQAKAQRYGGGARAAQQHDVPERIPVTPQMYQRLTAKIAGTPEERILAFLMLRSLKQARYARRTKGISRWRARATRTLRRRSGATRT